MVQAQDERAAATAATERLKVGCCVVGGGPAGVMTGFLLARAGVDVVVLEKHADFLRDFRGDTVHASTLELMAELGLLEPFLKRPHEEVTEFGGHIAGTDVTIADFAHLPVHCKFIAFMPQWDFLNFLVGEAQRYPTFRLRMQTRATDLVEEDGRIVGVRADGPAGPLEVRADLTIGCDGRGSIVRDRAGLTVRVLGAPMDILWMRIPWRKGDPRAPVGRFGAGKMLVLIYRGEYWQCGFVIPKGGYDAIRARGLEALRQDIVETAPFLAGRLDGLDDWESIRLLTVAVDRLDQWYRPGLLCIGDAAHAMSPVGGVGINLAVQDAVATANILAGPLREGTVALDHLREVQKRRIFPTKMTQRMQIVIQNRVVRNTLEHDKPIRVPWPVRLFNRFPLLRRIPGRLVGLGIRPEHIRTPDMLASSERSQLREPATAPASGPLSADARR